MSRTGRSFPATVIIRRAPLRVIPPTVDADTALLTLTVSGSEVATFTDSALVANYLDISQSAPDVAQFTEAATGGLALTPSTLEQIEHTDASIAAVGFSPSSTEIKATETTDSGTESLAFTPSSTETYSQAPDAATITIKTTPVLGTVTDISTYIDGSPNIPPIRSYDQTIFNTGSDFDDPILETGQKIVPAVSDTTREIDCIISKVNNPTDNVVIKIRADNSGKPGAVLGSVAIPAASLPDTANRHVFSVPLVGIPLVAGTTYYVTFVRSGVTDVTNRPRTWRYTDPGTKFGLNYTPSTDTVSQSGNFDLYIGIRYTDVPTDVHFTLSPSGAESADLVESTTVGFALTPSSTEIYFQAPDANTISLKFTPGISSAGLGEVAVYVENPPDIKSAFTFEELGFTSVISDPNQWCVQQFTAPVSGVSRVVETFLRQVGTLTDSCIVEIRSISGGKPGSVLASTSVLGSNISTAGIITNVPVSGANLVGGTDYFIVWRRSGSLDNANHIRIAGSTKFPPSNGYTYNATTTGFPSIGGNFYFGVRFTDQVTDVHLTLSPSGVESVGLTESATVGFALMPDGSETYTPIAVAYTDSGTASLGLIPGAIDVGEFADANTSKITLSAAAEGDVLASTDSQTSVVAFTPSSAEVGTFVDANTSNIVTAASSAEVLASTDAQTCNLAITPSSTEQQLALATIALSQAGAIGHKTSTAVSTIDIPYPTVSANDLMVLFVAGNGTVMTTPAGWTEIFKPATVTNPRGFLAIKKAVGTEAGNLTVTVGTAIANGVIEAFTGVDQTTPQDVAAAVVENTATVPCVIPTLSTVTPNAMLVYCAAFNSSAVTCTSSGTEDHDFTQEGTSEKSGAIYHETDATAGATGTRTITASSARANFGAMIALRPAVITAGVTYTDSGTLTVGLLPSSAEIRAISDSGTANALFTPSAADISVLVDASTTSLGLSILAAAEVLASVDSLTSNVILTPSATEVKLGTGIDASTVPVALLASSTDVRESIEAAVVNLLLSGSGVDAAASVDSQTSVISFVPDVAEVLGVVDARTASVLFGVSGLETVGITTQDTAAVGFLFNVSGVERTEFAEASTTDVVFTPQSVEVLTSVDSSTAVIVLSPVIEEVEEYIDESVALLLFGVSGSDVVLAKHVNAIFRGHGNGSRYNVHSTGRVKASPVGGWKVKATTGRFHAHNQ